MWESNSLPIDHLPESTIPLSGFPLCKGRGNTCLQEVRDRKTLCTACGGPPLSEDIMRRTYLRQLRMAVAKVLECPNCQDKDPMGARCLDCAFNSGAAYALGGIVERLGWAEDSNPLMALIFKPRSMSTA